jgi:KDO2-lipid IV(A) lauroyltransferase
VTAVVSRRIKHRLEDAALALIIALLGPLGFRGAQRFGSFLATLWYYGYRRRVDVSMANIDRAFGGTLDRRAVRRLSLESYRNIGRTFLEFARFPYMDARRAAELVTFSNPEILDDLARRGKGAILVTGHYGNWELIGAAVAGRGYPISFVVGRQGNALVDRRINRYRGGMGVGIIERGVALREIPRALRRGEFVALLADQDAGRSGVFVDFLGTPASTPKGAAHFAFRFGAPILFGVTVRGGDGRHRAELFDPIWPRENADTDEEVLRLTRAYTAYLEEAVYRHPEQYFWPHRRWKTKPPAEEDRS